MLIERTTLLYKMMQQDIEHCRKKDLGRLCEVECCFQMAERYWGKLRHDVSKFEFETLEDEIRFFKEVKPLFTSEVEYYSLRYHAELFRNAVSDECELQKFWRREQQRLDRFRSENDDFYRYYKEGDRYRDELYFVRRNSDLSNFPRARVYDLDENATTSHDSLVSTLLALERYVAFVEDEMKTLHGS